MRFFKLPEGQNHQDQQTPQAGGSGDKHGIHEQLLSQMNDRSLLIDA
jgi:hypothetical protein